MLTADQIAPVALGVIVVLTALTPAAIVFAWLLRRSAMIGGPAAAGILGGAIAGILLGATVLGGSAPGVFDSIYIGGAEESAALQEAQRESERELAALGASGVSRAAIREHRERDEQRLIRLADRVTAARRLRARSVDSAALLLGIAVMALGAGWAGRVRARSLTAGAVASGFGMVLGAGVPVCLTAIWLGPMSNVQAWTLGGAIGIGSAWPTARSRAFGTAGRSPETDASALAALCIGLAAVVMAVLSVASIRSFAGAWSVVVVAVAVASVAWRVRTRRPRSQRRSLALCNGVVTPALTAVCVAPIDLSATLITRVCVVASLAALFFASDGRWFGAWIGWRLFGDDAARRTAWTRSAAALANNVGVISIAAGALGRSAGLIDSPGMVALVLGALVVETTTGLRRRFAGTLDDTIALRQRDSADDDDDPNRDPDDGRQHRRRHAGFQTTPLTTAPRPALMMHCSRVRENPDRF